MPRNKKKTKSIKTRRKFVLLSAQGKHEILAETYGEAHVQVKTFLEKHGLKTKDIIDFYEVRL